MTKTFADIRSLLLTLLTAAACCYSASAQGPVLVDSLEEATVQSVRLRPTVEPAESVSLLTRDRQTSVADVLRHFTGVQVKDYGGVGGLKTINIRSLGSEHVGIFLDGIQIENAQNMQVDLGRFSTEGIDMVRMYNGQKSGRLQTAKEYASGAAVHLSSDNLLYYRRNGIVRLRGGSFGTINPYLQWNKSLGKGVVLGTQAEFLSSNGEYRFSCFDSTLVRKNGDIKALRLEARLNGALNRGRLFLHAYAYGSERGFPGPVIRRAAGFPFSAERQADQDLFIQGGWENEWTTRYATSLKFKYSDDYTHYDSHPEINPMALPCDLHYRQQSAYLSLAQSYIISDPWSIDLSTDGQYNTLDSDVGQFVRPRRATFTGALATRAVWERFRVAAHLVYMGAWDFYDSPSAGGWSRENGFRDAWMPSATLLWIPARGLKLDAYAKRSYRLPSFNDLYYSQMGNSALVPEGAAQFGMGIRFEKRKGRWNWSGRVSPYLNRVSEKIVAIPTYSQFRWTMLNIGRVDVSGLDAKATLGYYSGGLGIRGIIRYSYQKALDHSTPGGPTYGNQIPYIPLHSGAFSLEADYGEWTFCWDTSLSGGKWSRTANIPDYYIEPWCLSDASLSRRIDCDFPDRHPGLVPELWLHLSCKNVFNTRYEIVQGYPMPGTNVMLSVEFKW